MCALALGLVAVNAVFAQSDSIPIWMAQDHVPGAVIGIIEHGKVTALRTFGELRPGVPMRSDALFNVASLTKPVVAMTTLALVSAGALRLDEPLDSYWIDPDIRDDSLHKKLTTRLILSHQTGFPNWRRMTATKKLAFLFVPGTRFGYSGEGFEYLRRALESKFGETLQHLSDSILFQPLGMRETTYGWNPQMDSLRFADGHDTNGVSLHIPKRPMTKASAADWLVTTVGDYSRFVAYTVNGAGLPSALFAEMATLQVKFDELPNQGMGLGWEVVLDPQIRERMLLHTGSDEGIKTMAVLLPESKRGLVIFTTGDRGMDVILRIVKASLNIKDLTP